MANLFGVQLSVESEEYAKQGVHKGANGWLCNSKHRGDRWQVFFPLAESENKHTIIFVKDDHLILTKKIKINACNS